MTLPHLVVSDAMNASNSSGAAASRLSPATPISRTLSAFA